MRAVAATRYVTPLREGGSLPALVEADDDGLYVLKFFGAGQGPKALVAEVVAGELGRALGLPSGARARRARPGDRPGGARPGDPGPAARERRDEPRRRLPPGRAALLPAAGPPPDPDLAAAIVWLDALVTNVDRTPQNPNLLWWHRRLWLIDHGAALYWHHSSGGSAADPQAPFAQIADHVLLPYASSVAEADARLAPLATRELLGAGRRGRSPTSGSTVRIVGCTSTTSRAGSRRRAGSPKRQSVPGDNAFSYAVLRLVPRVERGERINVGVVVFCRPLQYLEARTALDEARALVLWPDLDVESVRAHLAAIERVAAGDPTAGPIAGLDTTARFHWLVAPSSTIIQPSVVHTGLCGPPADELDELFRGLVVVA